MQSVDLCVKENSAAHYTDDYDLVQSDTPALVARRGFPIALKIKFKRTFDKEKDIVCLVFTVKSKIYIIFRLPQNIFCFLSVASFLE